jgi:anti-sigma-K factor RskA
MTDSDDRTLAGEYVLGLLEGAAKLDAERRLVADAAFAREVESWRVRFAAFDDAAEPHPVGDELWRKIESGVPAAASRAKAPPGAWSQFWNNLAALRVTALGASFAALIFAVGLGFAIRAATQ